MDVLEKRVRMRIWLVAAVFVVAFGLIVARAFHLQVLCQEDWQKRAERQHQKVIPLTPQRGTIYDRNAQELALSVEVDSIYVEPRNIENPTAAAKALAAALSLPVASLQAKLKSNKSFIWIKRQVSPRESQEVRALQLAGVNFIKEHKRYYPNSQIAAQVIGFTGLDPEGLEGIELKYDSTVLGEGGYLTTERDALGRGIGSGEPVIHGAKRGSDLYLTLDKQIQYIAEKELAAGVQKAKAQSGSIVVLDPETGKILAMASQPDYNPNAFFSYRPSDWRNRALGDSFEPGSTLKVFLLAAALNEKVTRADAVIDCEKGSYRVGGIAIHDHHPYADLSVAEILKVSSNIGSAKIGKALERERLYDYLRAFGFGERTGIDLPGEANGLLRKPSQWFEADLAAISFGQGLTVTSLQLASATAAIANGGDLLAPYVVERIVDGYGETVEERQPQVVNRVVSADVARQIREMMVSVTEPGGTGTQAAVPGFRVGGKTGTAQKVDPVTGGYSADKRVSSFVGFAPADRPRLVIMVMIDEPKGQTYGGVVAGPVFSRVAGQVLRYLQVPPNLPTEPAVLPPVPKLAAAPAPKPVGAIAGTQEGLQMPDCVGMSYRQVLEIMERSGLNIKLRGSGRVVEQAPRAGHPISYANEVWVRLGPPS